MLQEESTKTLQIEDNGNNILSKSFVLVTESEIIICVVYNILNNYVLN